MATCTIFKNFTVPVENKSLLLIAKDIQSNKYKVEIEEIRLLETQGKTEEAQNKKKLLPAFTPSATFIEKRQLPFLNMYSSFIHLDFDKLNHEELNIAFETIIQIPYTFICFKSPRGNGLKVFIEVNTGLEHHELAYAKVLKFYEDKTGLKADPSCKDVTRLCFVSHDTRLYKNISNQKFIVAETPIKIDVPKQPTQTNGTVEEQISSLDSAFIFNQQVQFKNQKLSYENGNRNNYIYLLASNCNRVGLSKSDTEILCATHFDLSQREIQTAVNSAFTHHLQEHNSILPTLQTQDNATEEKEMPKLPDDIFPTLPTFLKSIVSVATSNEERDILLLSSLVTLSVALPNIVGKYDDKFYKANLFLFITAKASAGKGIIIHCRKLVEPIHNSLKQRAKMLKREYESDMAIFNANKGKDTTVEKPTKPPQTMLFIPANNSSTGFFELLNDNEGKGIIFETEADTMAQSFKNDYGNYSDGFRKAFHHEPISYYRRTDKEFVEIERPNLSALLTGTPNQIAALIPNAENGLFSRFIFYMMDIKNVWKNVFASKTENGLEHHFQNLGNEFYNFYCEMLKQKQIEFALTRFQEEEFNKFFSHIQDLYIALKDDEYIATIRRLGLIAFRLMMIKTALRVMENGDVSDTIICDDIDFQNTLKMVEVLIKHSAEVYSNLISETPVAKTKKPKDLFLAALPKEFSRQGYLEIASKYNINPKTAEGYIGKFVKVGVLITPRHDHYTNPNV
jgi:Protein of unknown function (DUF3987)/VirE N-terminal domain